jgi:hypothetical protein
MLFQLKRSCSLMNSRACERCCSLFNSLKPKNNILIIQSVPQRKHNSSPLHRSTG